MSYIMMYTCILTHVSSYDHGARSAESEVLLLPGIALVGINLIHNISYRMSKVVSRC